MSNIDRGSETLNPVQAAVARPAEAWSLPPSQGTLRRLARYARTKPLGTFSLVVISLLVLTALLAPFLTPYNPYAGTTVLSLRPPSLAHPFGTDTAGRDVLSRVIYGSRASLWTSLVAVGLGTLSGTLLGLLSGLFGGWFDTLLQRIIDAAMSVPLLLLAVVIVSLVKPSLNNILIALSISIVFATWSLFRRSIDLVLASVPADIDPDEVRAYQHPVHDAVGRVENPLPSKRADGDRRDPRQQNEESHEAPPRERVLQREREDVGAEQHENLRGDREDERILQ